MKELHRERELRESCERAAERATRELQREPQESHKRAAKELRESCGEVLKVEQKEDYRETQLLKLESMNSYFQEDLQFSNDDEIAGIKVLELQPATLRLEGRESQKCSLKTIWLEKKCGV